MRQSHAGTGGSPATALVLAGPGHAPLLAGVLDASVSLYAADLETVDGRVIGDVEVVIVDTRHGDVNLDDTSRRLRQAAATRDLPVVAVVDAVGGDVAAAALDAGADAVADVAGGRSAVAAVVGAVRRRHRRHREALEDTRRTASGDMARLRHELDALAYAVSHDLRAPLRSIDGFSAALADVLADDLDPKAADYLRRVRAAAHRLGLMIEGLLELSRAGRAPFAPQATDLSELIRAAAAAVARRYENPPVVAVSEGLEAHVDRDLAQRLFERALDNCCKFSVRAATPSVAVEAAMTPAGPEYLVRDNGVGFDMTYAGKLFRPFQRLHGAGEYPGVGVGLALVHRVVERHGGRVAIESAPGAGTTLRFTLAPPPEGAGEAGGETR